MLFFITSKLHWPTVHPSIYISITIAEIDCGQPPEAANATVAVLTTLYQDGANYTCVPGYEVPDYGQIYEVTCHENKSWSEFPGCKRNAI